MAWICPEHDALDGRDGGSVVASTWRKNVTYQRDLRASELLSPDELAVWLATFESESSREDAPVQI
jgi:hypothetical protein